MIYTLEKAIKHALAQTPFNDKGDLISCIKISQSAISIFTNLDYKSIDVNGVTDIIPEISNEIFLYEDQFNIPINEIDTYIRYRPRIIPLESNTETDEGDPLYNLRTLYKMSQSTVLSPENEKENFPATYIYLVVRDLYFRDTKEGNAVANSMGLYEGTDKIDAKLFLAEYQASDADDMLLAIAMKHGYNKVKFDSVFKILYGESPNGKIIRLENLPKVFEKGGKVLKFNELAYFYKSSIPLELNFMEKSDNHCDKIITYELFNFNKATVKTDILYKMSTAKGITLVNNLIPDEIIDYLFPLPSVKFLPKSVACLQLEEISNFNPQYPIETYDEFSRSVSSGMTIHSHIEEQKNALTKKSFDVFIVPNISMINAQILEQSIDKHIIVIVKSKNYLQLSSELFNIHDVNIRKEFINKLNAFVNVGVSKNECTSYNIIHSTIKTLLQTESPLLTHLMFNDHISKVFISYSALIFKRFVERDDINTLMLSRGTLPKYIAKKNQEVQNLVFEPYLQVDFMTIVCMLMKLTSKDVLSEVRNGRVSFTATYAHAGNKAQTFKVTVYSSSEEGIDLNLTIKKYTPYNLPKLIEQNSIDGSLNKIINSYERIISSDTDNIIMAVKDKRQMKNAVSYYIHNYLTEGKAVLLVDPLYSIHEDMYDKGLLGTLRVLRTKNKDMISHVSSDLNPEITIFYNCDIPILIDILDDTEDSTVNLFMINVSTEELLVSKLDDQQKGKYRGAVTAFMSI